MISSSNKRDSCSQLVAGNYDVLFDDDFDISTNAPNNKAHQQLQQQQPHKDELGYDTVHERLRKKAKTVLRSVLTRVLENYERYETELATDPNECGYVQEFRMLKEESESYKQDTDMIYGQLECNLRKNRYKDIIPFDYARVILKSDPSIPGSDYINASFIEGQSEHSKAYIACQGPLLSTLDDFWRMIWECNVPIIIMACNEHESGKQKCELYWPKQIGGSECYGNIRVHLVRVRQICKDFLIRKFSIDLLEPSDQSNNNVDEIQSSDQQQHQHQIPTTQLETNPATNDEQNHNGQQSENDIKDVNNSTHRRVLAKRTICQFHYTTWPDHGAPDSVQPILELVRLLREVQPTEDKPVLVHCSAGCGRTGTICCIDYAWNCIKNNNLDPDFSVFDVIARMRQLRMSMVQTLEQYILCYRAVAVLFRKHLKDLDSIDMNQDCLVERSDDMASTRIRRVFI